MDLLADRAAKRTYPTPLLLLVFAAGFGAAAAQDTKLGGSLRGYQFFGERSPFTDRRDSELWILRLTSLTSVQKSVLVEVDGVLSLLSPPLTGTSRIAVTNSRVFLPLDYDFTDDEDVDLLGSFDRLNLEWELGATRLKIGRQAITWGVSFFWPAMDLFAPFAPQQIDRDYKAGVDAIRFTLPLGNFSEFETVAAALGSSASKDGAAAAFLRLNIRNVDVAWMGGKFHQDTVAGVFLTGDLSGTGLRGELTWTDSGDARDETLGLSQFFRGSVGLDRQLTPTVGLTLEVAYNGFGSNDADRYLALAGADRVLRGEVNAFGKIYTGLSASWQLHPLLILTPTVLINWNDRSSLWVPTLSWSTGNNSEVLAGAQLGFGKGVSPDLRPASEYGSVASSIFGAFRLFF